MINVTSASVYGKIAEAGVPIVSNCCKRRNSLISFGCTRYAFYLAGPFYLVTRSAALRLLEASKHRNFHKIEDTLITGVLADDTDVSRVQLHLRMTTAIQYQVIPLADREHSNKVASILENKYKTATNKRITLNERFGVLEKGYTIQATEPETVKNDSDVFFVVHDRNLNSKKEFVENYLAKNPIVNSPEKVFEEEDKENAPTKKAVLKPSSTDEKKLTSSDIYIQEITRSILQSV